MEISSQLDENDEDLDRIDGNRWTQQKCLNTISAVSDVENRRMRPGFTHDVSFEPTLCAVHDDGVKAMSRGDRRQMRCKNQHKQY